MIKPLLAVLLWTVMSFAWSAEKLPVIFVHGIWVNWEVYEYLIPLKRLFDRHGYELHIAQTPAGGSLEERAQTLHRELKRLVPQGKYHLIGHSMGGLDARLAIRKYDLGERCASLTTLATPHRGSVVADFFVNNYSDSKIVEILERHFPSDLRAIRQLTTFHMNTVFNKEVPNDPRVKYFSMQFFIPRPVKAHSAIPWLWLAHAIQTANGHDKSDGMVSVESARWGESLGEFPGDHYTETAPFPLGGKIHYQDVFKRVIKNLNKKF